jgi:hypothetical protein
MKLRNLLFIAVATLLSFSSCQKDEDESIIGTWEYDTMTFEIETTDPETTKFIQEIFDSFKNLISMTLTIEVAGTYSLTASIPMLGTETITGTYRLENGKLILDDETIINYDLSKRRLTLNFNSSDDFMIPIDIVDGIIDPTIITKFNISMSFDKK